MVKRITVFLDEDLYEYLIKESIMRYGSSKQLSQLINELLKKAIFDKEKASQLLLKEKLAKTTAKEFEDFRRELSKKIEE